MSTAMSWPADVIHVNEDGWVLINRGSRHGVAPGLRLLVVGQGTRELRDLFSAEVAADAPAEALPVVLRIRRTYELLEVIHAEEQCAVAIAARIPAARRPSVYRGPDGELLVWSPLPADFTWPPPGAASDDTDMSGETGASAADAATDDAGGANQVDAPPEESEQDDARWEQALPLNGVNVGDIVLPAIPATSSASAVASATPAAVVSSGAPASAHQDTPFDAGRAYDWLKPGS
ncbi:MAG: hypothetical protein OJF49_001545 [Ktedonobacterales bacterium]|nr:MAG: hypothetical protein OJF49_001545 [Ktedonobacterales bacterium]